MTRLSITIPLACLACVERPLTAAEILTALDEAHSSARGEEATAEPIEVDTDFTIGGALQDAAAELAAFWTTQAPCSTVTVDGATVTVDYGDGEDTCLYNGMSWSGLAQVSVLSTTPGELEVDHSWTAFRNEDTQVDGTAEVTWSGNDLSRHVATEHTWSDLATGDTMDVLGDHTQGLLDEGAGLLGGITMAGSRDWTHDGSTWHLDMTDLEIRFQDPAPQAGTLTVVHPRGPELTITYSRVDDATIAAVVTGGRRELTFHIHALGLIEEVTTP